MRRNYDRYIVFTRKYNIEFHINFSPSFLWNKLSFLTIKDYILNIRKIVDLFTFFMILFE